MLPAKRFEVFSTTDVPHDADPAEGPDSQATSTHDHHHGHPDSQTNCDQKHQSGHPLGHTTVTRSTSGDPVPPSNVGFGIRYALNRHRSTS
jgi:hypothetical protein